ncbi:MAG TPA: sigma-54 dependent transcriptional regulator [Verrucomicrobiae bacterium]|jgi:DNA-binding NtrC family response regulator|nr:sigma-54 dependent transcriptional regulator [Verrucomicrobiae bacterium]
MIISVLNTPLAKPIEAKLSALSLNCQRFSADSIKDLNHHSSETIYLIPKEILDSEEWSRLRAKLAEANRYFLVVGSGLSSAHIVQATRDGAYDVLQLEDDDARWMDSLEKVVQSQKLWLQLYGGRALDAEEMLIGQSAGIKSLRQAIERLGPTGASVLILGESGVGKEHVASALHSTTSKGPFVAVNCAAIPRELIEAEIFGAERGAYTGSVKAREGLVEQAAGGTLFLDEMGELDIALQPKLLRFLETRRARRVGGEGEYHVDLRVVSATNSNLESEIAAGKFRADLYYRLSEVSLRVPPLRARLEDIPLFIHTFLQAAGERFGRHFESVEPELIQKFQAYHWPGNVRELKNVIDRLVILYNGPVMRAGWWTPPEAAMVAEPMNAVQAKAEVRPEPVQANSPPLFAHRKQKMELAKKLLLESDNNQTWVAAQLGINPTTLYRWRKNKLV